MKQLSALVILVLVTTTSLAQQFEWHQVQRPVFAASSFTQGAGGDLYGDYVRWYSTDHGVTWNFRGPLIFTDKQASRIKLVGDKIFYVDTTGIFLYNIAASKFEHVHSDTLEVDPTPFVQLLGTSPGKVLAVNGAKYPYTLLISDEMGRSWAKLKGYVPLFPAPWYAFYSIDHQGRLYAFGNGNDDSYLSLDSGKTWDSVYSNSTRGDIQTVTHLHDGTTFATTYEPVQSPTLGKRWLLSCDGEGKNWRTVASLEGTSSPNKDSKFYLRSGSGTTLFAWTKRKYVGENNLLRSTDGGETWHDLPRGPKMRFAESLPFVDSAGIVYMHGSIDVNGENLMLYDGSVYYAGQPVIFVSNDDGTTWQIGGIPHISINSILYDSLRRSTFVIISMPNNYTPKAQSGYVGTLYRLTDSLNISKKIFGGWPTGPDTIITQFFIIDTFYVAHGKVGVEPKLLISSDGGKTWAGKTFPPGFATSHLAMHDNTLYAFTTSYDVFQSYDLGSTWQPLISGFNNMPEITAVGISTKRNFFIGAGPLVYRDRELYFKRLYPSISSNVTCFAFDSIGGMYVGTGIEGVISSTDDGETWKFLNHGLPPDTAVSALMVTPQGVLIAATYNGLYTMTVGDTVWQEQSKGLNDRRLLSLGMMDDDTYLVGTFNSGLYVNKPFPAPPLMLGVKLPPSVRIEGSSQLSANYPNPFALETTIRYEVTEPEWVRLEVYSMLGERVAVLENAHHEPGTYESSYNGANIPAGTYIYRLKIGAREEVRRMVKH